jgi:hypothetical protein
MHTTNVRQPHNDSTSTSACVPSTMGTYVPSERVACLARPVATNFTSPPPNNNPGICQRQGRRITVLGILLQLTA